jgi:hypothetical protein
VRDEKMLEKLTTHDIQDVVELFSMADKCARAAEGHAWHAQPTLEVGKVPSPKRALLPTEVAARIKRRRRRLVIVTNR